MKKISPEALASSLTREGEDGRGGWRNARVQQYRYQVETRLPTRGIATPMTGSLYCTSGGTISPQLAEQTRMMLAEQTRMVRKDNRVLPIVPEDIIHQEQEQL